MNTQKRRCLQQIIKSISGIDGKYIYSGYNTSSYPTQGLFIIMRYGDITEDEENGYYEKTGDIDVMFYNEDVTIDCYSDDDYRCKQILQKIKKNITNEKFCDIINGSSMDLVDLSDITDLSYITDNKSSDCQFRSRLVLTVRYNSDDDFDIDNYVGIINTVDYSNNNNNFEATGGHNE